jgi:hypothetical protein
MKSFFLFILITTLYSPVYSQIDIYKTGQLSGLKDHQTGKIIVPASFYQLHKLSPQLYVGKRTLFGIIDSTGKEVLPFIYSSMNDEAIRHIANLTDKGFISHKEISLNYNHRYEINEKGEKLNRTKPDRFSEIIANIIFKDKRVKTEASGKTHLLLSHNDSLEVSHYSFCLDTFLIHSKDHEYGIIDRNGRTIVPFIYDDIYCFTEGLSAVKKDNRYGFIDTTGKAIIPITYDQVYPFNNGRATVEKGGKYGCIDKDGKIVIPIIYEKVGSFRNGICAVMLNRKWGFVSENGSVKTPFEYDATYSLYKGGISAVSKLDKWGLIDSAGRVIRPLEYDIIKLDQNNIILHNKGKSGIIDFNNNIILPLEYDHISEYNRFLKDGLCLIQKNNRYGYINKYGKIVIPLKYDKATEFKDNVAIVSKNDKYINNFGLINNKGKKIFPFKYNEIYYSATGLFKIGKKGKQYQVGYCDINQKFIGGKLFDDMEIISSIQGHFFSIKNGQYWGLLDWTGKSILPCKYISLGCRYYGIVAKDSSGIHLFTYEGNQINAGNYDDIDHAPISGGDKIMVIKDKKRAIYNLKLNKFITSFYDSIETQPGLVPYEDIFLINQDGQTAAIDSGGKIIIPFGYQRLYFIKNEVDFLGAKKENKFGVINRFNETIIPFDYDSLITLEFKNTDLFLLARKNGQWLGLNYSGTPAMDFNKFSITEYSSIGYIDNDLFAVKKDKKYGIINTKGEVIVPLDYDYINHQQGISILNKKGKYYIFDQKTLEIKDR